MTAAPRRKYDLGAPGAEIQLTLRADTRPNIAWAFAGAVLMLALGASMLMRRSMWWLGFGCIVFALVVAWSTFRDRRRQLFLSDEHLLLGSIRAPRTIALAHIHRVFRLGEGDGELETLVLQFGPDNERAAALVPRDIADELEARLTVRARVTRGLGSDYVTAAETLHEAGPGAVGAFLARDGWRAFDNPDVLDERLSAHAFRDHERTRVFVSRTVADAIARRPDLAAKVEVVVAP